MRALAWPGSRVATAIALLVILVSASGDRRLAVAREPAPIAALAPVEVLATGFRQPSAVAVAPDGAVLVADRAAGTLTRIGADGDRALAASDLHAPVGVAVDRAGHVFVLEASARRILRVAPEGSITVVASIDARPEAMAVGPDNRLWVAMRGENRPRADDVIARVEGSGALTEVAAGFSEIEAIAVADGAVYVAMRRLVDERGAPRTTAARMPIREDGTAGTLEPLLSAVAGRVGGLAVDVLGNVFASAGDVVLKRHRHLQTEFARGLRGAGALAFTPGGDLIAVEAQNQRRVLRFRAPPLPVPAAPAFTNVSPVPIGGRAHPGDLVQLFRSFAAGEAVATTITDAGGAFTLAAPLIANARTELWFRATGAGGQGLTGAAVRAVVVHDDVLPRVAIVEPEAGAHVRGPVVLRARGDDEGSGVRTLSFLVDDTVVTAVRNPEPPAPLRASTVLETGRLAEGPHALTITADDRAGNTRAEAQLLVVDRTPPETRIASGPGAETVERSVRFTVEGTDLWAPSLEFSWRLDDGAWSPFRGDTVVDLRDLAPGPHRFEVKARDLAGNEDQTPAVYAFVIRSLRVHILEPTEGAAIVSSAIWIRGTVEGAIGDTAVRLVLPAPFAGIIAAPVEAGFFAMQVPAEPAFATLTVLAADGSGASAQASVSVVIAPDGTSDESLEVWPPGGLAPLRVRIGLHGFSAAPLSIDLEGDGTDEFSGITGADDFQATYTRPGIYLPVVRVTTPDGDVLVRRGLVEVYDGVALEARLQAVWTGFKDALRNGDVDAAASFIVAERREAWAEYFRGLPPEMLGDIDAIFPAITFVEAGAGGAQYEMVAERDGVMASYPVWFQIDTDGRWRLWRF